jgi:hypothetical protein
VTDAGGDASDAKRPPFDAGCFVPMGSSEPDANAALIYGSCIPHFDGAAAVCFESGHVGILPDSGAMGALLEASCTGLPVDGTWSPGPCDLSTAVFGCVSETFVGSVCAEVTTTWFYPPTTIPDQVADCPPPLLVVYPPVSSDP